MELKFLTASKAKELTHSFNCTFMELKCENTDIGGKAASSFNCTFMELKFLI